MVLAVLLIIANLFSGFASAATVAEVVGQISRESYTNYLREELYTHDGDERCFGPQHDLAQQRIRELFESFGLETSLHPFEYQETTYYNVVGVHRGISCPNETYVLGAHYDSVEGAPGAMDNGSGVAGLLESARVLSQYAFEGTIVFIAFDREEQGMRGSTAYANDHIGDRIHGMLNLDCIAALACEPEHPDYNEIRLSWNILHKLGEPTLLVEDLRIAIESYTDLTCVANPYLAVFGGSDHDSFANVGFQAVQFEPYSCQEDPLLGIHTPLDSVDQLDWIDYGQGTRVTQAVVAGLATLAMLIPGGHAHNPVPADGSTDVLPDTMLTWAPGNLAQTHDVYFGTVFDDVSNASRDNPMDVLVSQGQEPNSWDPPGLLNFGQTYYWRIDEVNAPPSDTIFKGNVWSIATEPPYYTVEGITVTASVPTALSSGEPGATVDGSGLVNDLHDAADATMWAGIGVAGDPLWLQFDFDRVYKLHEMHVWNYNGQFESILGFGLKDVTIEYATDANDWTVLGDFEVPQAPGQVAYAGTTIAAGGIAARSVRLNVRSNRNAFQANNFGLAEIQFLYKPVVAREPKPADGATGVSAYTSLTWRPGHEAVSHEVFFSTNRNTVADGSALVDTVTESSYLPGPLDPGQTYYWKVNEVNEAELISVWEGDVWEFTTVE